MKWLILNYTKNQNYHDKGLYQLNFTKFDQCGLQHYRQFSTKSNCEETI